MFYEPRNGHGLPHDPLRAIIAPRPIGWISTRRRDGSINLGPYSYYNAICTRPTIVCFCSERDKDSATIAQETGEFVVNLVSRPLAEKMNESSIDAPSGVSEFELAGLTPADCRLVSCPRVAEAPAALECKVTEVLRPRDMHGESTGSLMIMGQVIGVHIQDAMLTDGLFDVTKAQNLSRLGYMDYTSITEKFSMRRPRWEERYPDTAG